jgi:hypothetical protein
MVADLRQKANKFLQLQNKKTKQTAKITIFPKHTNSTSPASLFDLIQTKTFFPLICKLKFKISFIGQQFPFFEKKIVVT